MITKDHKAKKKPAGRDERAELSPAYELLLVNLEPVLHLGETSDASLHVPGFSSAGAGICLSAAGPLADGEDPNGAVTPSLGFSAIAAAQRVAADHATHEGPGQGYAGIG